MALDDIEVAPRFELLDTNAVGDGEFVHSHTLRSTAMSVNHLARETECILSLTWRSDVPGSTESVRHAIRGVGYWKWTKLVPGAFIRPKLPRVRTADVLMRADLPLDDRLLLQVATVRRGFDPNARSVSDNVVELRGTGALDDYELRDLLVDPGNRERFEVWCRGEPDTSATADPTNYTSSGAERGQVLQVATGNGTQIIASAGSGTNWNTPPGLTWAPSHVLIVHDGPNAATIGNTLYMGLIISVDTASSCTVWPSPAPSLARALPQRYFAIYRLPTIRLVDFSIWSNRPF